MRHVAASLITDTHTHIYRMTTVTLVHAPRVKKAWINYNLPSIHLQLQAFYPLVLDIGLCYCDVFR